YDSQTYLIVQMILALPVSAMVCNLRHPGTFAGLPEDPVWVDPMLGDPVRVLVPRVWSVGLSNPHRPPRVMMISSVPSVSRRQELGPRRKSSVHESVRYRTPVYIRRELYHGRTIFSLAGVCEMYNMFGQENKGSYVTECCGFRHSWSSTGLVSVAKQYSNVCIYLAFS
uniref:Uncharacterized protein n=1 Tax=Aegilops tauschii subsp. strangulata TaxID=200361 RepID=A0A453DLU1_AEGTS